MKGFKQGRDLIRSVLQGVTVTAARRLTGQQAGELETYPENPYEFQLKLVAWNTWTE